MIKPAQAGFFVSGIRATHDSRGMDRDDAAMRGK
jgi:hypothetical protein